MRRALSIGDLLGAIVRTTRRAFGIGCGALTLVGCGGGGDGGDTPVGPGPTVQSVTVTPGTQTLSGSGATGQLTAAVVRTDGPVASPVVTWVSQNTAIATVAGTGAIATVTAVSAGTATITATSGGVSGSATVSVTQPPAAVASVVVAAPLTNLDEGATGQLTVTVRDAAGNALTGRPVTWSSSQQATATVSATGLVTAVAEGDTVTVTATSEGVSGTAKVVVRSLYFIASDVSVGGSGEHTCAVRVIGGTYCWGRRGEGQLGNPANPGLGARVVTAGPNVFVRVTTGLFHSCGLTSAGAAHCFGSNTDRELGAGSTNGLEQLPVAVSGGLTFSQLSARWVSTCGLTANGAAYCWGYNPGGALGVGSTALTLAAPTAVVGDHRFRSIVVGKVHTCAIDTDDALWCWGWGGDGELGVGQQTSYITTPTRVKPGTRFKAVAAGNSHTCAIDADGRVWCTGGNQYGEIGDGTMQWRYAMVRIASNLTFTQITAGDRSTCAVASSGDIWCWGFNDVGQHGTGTTTNASVPVKTVSSVPFTTVAMGHRTTCAIGVNRRLYCWGFNGGGQGGGTPSFSNTTPVAVLRP